MRQHSNLAKDTAEKVVKDIRRATRKQYRRRKRSGSFWKACAARTASPSCAAARVSRRTCTIAGRRTSWRLARSAWPVTRLVPQLRTRSRICGREATALKEVVADLTLENRLLKKSVTADGGRTRHEILRLGEAGDHPAGRTIPPAGSSHARANRDPEIGRGRGLVADALRTIVTQQVRCRGTRPVV